MSDKSVNKKRHFVQKGVFYAELNDFLRTELEQDVSEPGYSIGYAGVEVRHVPSRLEIIIRATKTKHVVGTQGRRIRELTALVKKRFNLDPEDGDAQGFKVELFAERVQYRALCALAQAEAVKFKLMEGLAVRRACYRALRFIMENEAKGCEIVVSGKLRGQRAKAFKIAGGYMITSGQAKNDFIDQAVKHVKLRQGVLGIKVKIMLPHDRNNPGSVKRLPDEVVIKEKKKSAWELDPSELQKGYQQVVNEDVQEQMVAEEFVGQEEFGQPPMPQDPQMGYDQGAVPAAATPMEPAVPVEQQQQPAYGQPQPQYGQPEMGQTPGGDFGQY